MNTQVVTSGTARTGRANDGQDEATGVCVGGPVVRSPKEVFTSKPFLALLALVALIVGAQLQPFGTLRVLSARAPTEESETPLPPQVTGEAALDMESTAQLELAQPEDVHLPSGPKGPIARRSTPFEELPDLHAEQPPIAIEDPTGSLHPFYEALARTALKQPGAISRISYFGDSLVASDYVTATLRRRLRLEQETN